MFKIFKGTGYDLLNRLLTVTGNSTECYAYDLLDNRLRQDDGTTYTHYAYDAANQLLGTCVNASLTPCTPPTQFTYDLTGNLVGRTDGPTPITLGYDSENRLVWVGGPAQVPQTYGYDDQGRRVRKTTGAATAYYLYNGPDIVAEYDSPWVTPTARTTHGPNMDDPLLRTTAIGTQYYHQDGLGSVVALSNPDGTTAGTARYDAWGVKLAGTGTIPQYGYTGREPDETGLLYYRAR